ncbi:hypothetical protein CSUI_008098 [Cystoisospora suis]|uniref:Transmembrane protein n=1 Tax=Cystoisospora suis TaxID=483139 RepID=A0A2C6KN82_9APIC|nr:hypothetical protein CSUI_008098 [Cystoisospora suis]
MTGATFLEESFSQHSFIFVLCISSLIRLHLGAFTCTHFSFFLYFLSSFQDVQSARALKATTSFPSYSLTLLSFFLPPPFFPSFRLFPSFLLLSFCLHEKWLFIESRLVQVLLPCHLQSRWRRRRRRKSLFLAPRRMKSSSRSRNLTEISLFPLLLKRRNSLLLPSRLCWVLIRKAIMRKKKLAMRTTKKFFQMMPKEFYQKTTKLKDRILRMTEKR